MIGYREPTIKEAELFLEKLMQDWCYDTISNIREISKEEALKDFNMDDWKNIKVSG